MWRGVDCSQELDGGVSVGWFESWKVVCTIVRVVTRRRDEEHRREDNAARKQSGRNRGIFRYCLVICVSFLCQCRP